MQIALSQELGDQPYFRRNTNVTAFTEGWGLYSEFLGIEMGIYRTPYERFGKLSYEMWRACRLVADTGIHWKGWSKEQARRCFIENSALSEGNIEAELNRYIGWPGQALAYKIGELKLKELRARAEQRMGSRFDVRRFHDAVLLSGALPMDVLEQRIDAWIAAGAPGSPAAGPTDRAAGEILQPGFRQGSIRLQPEHGGFQVKRLAMFFGAAAITAGAAGAASAQGILDQIFGGFGQQRTSGSITLWSEPGFRGEALTVYGSDEELGRRNFNDRARSVQANGSLLLCEDNFFRGRCERISGSIPDLSRLGLDGRLSSVRVEGRRYGGGTDRAAMTSGYGRAGTARRLRRRVCGGYGQVRRDGVEGRTAVLFPRPSIQGGAAPPVGNIGGPFLPAAGYTAARSTPPRAARARRRRGRPHGRRAGPADVLCRP